MTVLFYLAPGAAPARRPAARALPRRAAAPAARRAPGPARARASPPCRPRATCSSPGRRLPRGGALLGAALAGRAPPPDRRAALVAAPADVDREERIQMKAKKLVPAALLALALLAPAAAQAHVTLQPNEAPEGAYTVLDVRVPNESDSENTTKVAVQFPEGFGDVSYQAVPGWKVKVVHEKLKKPIQTDDGPVTEGVKRGHLQRRQAAAGAVPGLPAVAADPRQGRRRADLQGGADLRKGSRPLDRGAGNRTPGAAGAGDAAEGTGQATTTVARRTERRSRCDERIERLWLERQGPRDRGTRRRGDRAAGRWRRGVRVASEDGVRLVRDPVERPSAIRGSLHALRQSRVEADRPDAHPRLGD